MKKLFLLVTLFIGFTQSGYSQPGNIDPLFGKNGSVRTDMGASMTQSSQARQVLLQADGSIYVIFQTSDVTIIAKKHTDSSPDSSYGAAGFSASVTMNTAGAVMQKDGKIVVAGSVRATDGGNYNFALARFNANGSLDSAFDGDGILTTDFDNNNDAVNSIAIQTDGKIVVTGSTYVPDDVDPKVALARYNTNGSLDNTFDADGRLKTGLQSTNNNSDLAAIQTDGKIVVSCLGDSRVIRLARFNSNGSADNTFNNTNSTIGSPETPFVAKAMALQADGKIVLGGAITNTNGYSDFALVRFTKNGKPDSTFGSNAIQTTDFRTFSDIINAIAIQSDGKIVAAGSASKEVDYAFAIARYNTNGSLDSTFDGDGKKMNYIGTYSVSAVSIAIQNNGKLVAAGYNARYVQSDYLTNIAIAKYNAKGSLDSTFHGTGALIDHYGQKNTVFTGSAAQKDGKIVAAGYAWNGKNFDFAVARYNTNGSLDNSFSTDGIALTDIGSSDNRANAVAIQADGKIVVAGYASNGTNDDFAVVRYNADGTLDKTFSSDGIQITDFGFREVANALAIQSNGKIVVAGTLYEQYQSDDDKAGLVRYNADGSLDNTFSEDGKQKSAPDLYGASFAGIAIQSDGKIVVAGTAEYGVMVARYKTNGSLDSAFGYDGITKLAISIDQDGGFTYGYSITIQKDGKIIVGAENGYFGKGGKFSDILIARFNSNGSLDNSFSQDGYVELLYSTDNASVKLQNDGKIVVVSNRYDYVDYGNDDFQEIKLGYVLARLNNNGTADSTFGLNGTQYIPNTANIQIQSTTIANNKLYAVGYGKDVNNYGFLSSYFLTGNKAPTVSITSPANNTVYTAPATININATAADSDGTITSVKFYNGSTYLKTDFTSPYSYAITNLPAGTYYLTAKATDNAGAQTISAPVKVVVNGAPAVKITSPANNAVYTAPATIIVNATASDPDGSIYSVKFYKDSTYLKTDFTSPYSYTISNLPAGTYSLTVKATDNLGAQTISAPVTVTVSNSAIVSNKPYSENEKTTQNSALNLRLSPNPATYIVNIQTSGLQQNKPATLSIISISGNVLKTVQISNSSTQLDVSTLQSGVYTIKIVSGNKVKYIQFVKL